MANQIEGYKLIFSKQGVDKTVLIRKMKISDRVKATEAVAALNKSDNQWVYLAMMSLELVKMLLHSVNGKVLSPEEKEDLDAIFSMDEYGQLEQFVKDNMLGKPDAKPQVEVVADVS